MGNTASFDESFLDDEVEEEEYLQTAVPEPASTRQRQEPTTATMQFPARPSEAFFRSSSSSLINMLREAANNEMDQSSFSARPVTVPENRAGRHGSAAAAHISHVLQRSTANPVTAEMADNDDTCCQPPPLQNFEWMGRSIETLALGQRSVTPILPVPQEVDNHPDAAAYDSEMDESASSASLYQRSPSLEFGPRRSSIEFGGRSSSMSVGDGGRMRGGTIASYYNSHRSNSMGMIDGLQNSNTLHRVSRRRYSMAGASAASMAVPHRRRRSSSITTTNSTIEEAHAPAAGPNVALSLLARETMGRSKRWIGTRRTPAQRLEGFGGSCLLETMDKRSSGIVAEVSALDRAIAKGDWTETNTIVTRLVPRLMGDPHGVHHHGRGGAGRANLPDDPSLPPNTSKFHAGGGRLGLERDAFCWAGGVQVWMRVLTSEAFVGQDVAETNDARDMQRSTLLTRGQCWSEILITLRELIYAVPTLVHDGIILENDFVPYLFTLLAHDLVFEAAASLLEEILSIQSHSTPPVPAASEATLSDDEMELRAIQPVRTPPTFFLGRVPELYSLWRGFSFRQLAHFCRILALLIFEPEDRHDAPLKSMELLQLRRDRVVRAGSDPTVDMNQSIVLGDAELIERFLKLLRVMNYAPSLQKVSVYHAMVHFPFVADALLMLGLKELESWRDVSRLDRLARKLLEEDQSQQVSELGSISDMMEYLGQALNSPDQQQQQQSTQLGHMIHIINAAQQAGVVVGRSRRSRRRRRNGGREQEEPGADPLGSVRSPQRPEGAHPESNTNSRVSPTEQRGNADQDDEEVEEERIEVIGLDASPGSEPMIRTAVRVRINSPEDAANELQFNALILAPYQVEVLFVLCTLLGGRRKVDAQTVLDQFGLIGTLEEMFPRLSWGSHGRHRSYHGHNESPSPASGEISRGGTVDSTNNNDSNGNNQGDDEHHGIHGPGCECTPESALTVQYLRLLHNFCDRDCDNYIARRQMLSKEEREYIFANRDWRTALNPRRMEKGLFSYIAQAFQAETDDSPYRFWLASCAESYLRGSSPQEQLFAARSGLLEHLVQDITSDRLHCAGSLQTSFDLLGELCKGNSDVLQLLLSMMDEDCFRRLMSSAAANLVDSNVFLRSLLLSMERIASGRLVDPYNDQPWRGKSGPGTRFYLTQSWWDIESISTEQQKPPWRSGRRTPYSPTKAEIDNDHSRTTDWFPEQHSAVSLLNMFAGGDEPATATVDPPISSAAGIIGQNGWLFAPTEDHNHRVVDLHEAVYSSNTLERLAWFLWTNQTRFLRDLLSVVNLRNINHENICCLNTAVVLTIFAYRRNQLQDVLNELRQMKQDDEHDLWSSNNPDSDDDSILYNFRELLWFWTEYYTHRGRDRLSLEFSSHVRFQEWNEVVSKLMADNQQEECLSLVPHPFKLPKSPYQRASRIVDNTMYGAYRH